MAWQDELKPPMKGKAEVSKEAADARGSRGCSEWEKLNARAFQLGVISREVIRKQLAHGTSRWMSAE